MTSPVSPSLPALRQLAEQAAWSAQGEVDGTTVVVPVEDLRALGTHLPALLDRLERQAAAIEAVQELHVADAAGDCRRCCHAWPCATASALSTSGITPTTEENPK